MLRLFNTLTRGVDPFVALTPGQVRMYTCGPTVYRPVHLGNLRSYLLADWLRRAFEFDGLAVTHVKNITDVGHMRQDAVDRGEDKVIAAAIAEGKTPMQIAASYEARFIEDEKDLCILPASVYPRATAHVPDMIALVERLIARGLAYDVDGTVYFSVRTYPGYGRLSGNVQEALKQGVRAEIDPAKRHPSDFALWKRAEPGREALTWKSPWSEGYPGWHIECSAMSTRYLGETFDVHTGGVDNIFPHHEDEIAQSEGAFGHPVVGTWVHGQHLLADGVKMAKSAGNTMEVSQLKARGIDPLAFRYQSLLTHYRARMQFTEAALRQAAEGLDHLRQRVRHLAQLSRGGRATAAGSLWLVRFRERVHDDLDLPGALAVAQACVTDGESSARDRLHAVLAMDAVLGLDLASVAREHETAPAEIRKAADAHRRERAALRHEHADALRAGFDGWRVDDHAGPAVLISDGRRRLGPRPQSRISSGLELPDRRAEAAKGSWAVCIVSREYPEDLARCVASVVRWLPKDGDVFVLDQGSSDDTVRSVAALDGGPVHVALMDRDVGEGAGRNALLRLARGKLILQLDPSVELTGDLFSELEKALRAPATGAAGPWGLRAVDHLKEFAEVTRGACDAIQGYCFATRREDLLAIGGFDERYRFYRNLDIATSLALRERGLASVAAGEGRATRHAHRAWERLGDDERQKRSRRNNDRLTKRFGGLGVGV
ncbi:MAG TPA: cysteine--tRNA ligase [Candidatus Limnocylindrales bacterium]|nr:cysteine--tRNA ligase [Candidatus Limnocylindrales bacterium]